MRGQFIVIEGMDGTGKTEQAERLALRLEASGRPTTQVREPGGTRAGEEIRNLVKSGLVRSARTELLLFNASRAELIDQVIVPALSAGTNVVSDRYVGSTTAYQGHGRRLPLQLVDEANAIGAAGLKADLTILLRASSETTTLRRGEREAEPDAFERESEEFTRRVERGYAETAARERWITISAEGSKDDVEARIWEAVNRGLKWPAEAERNNQRGGEP